MENKIPRDGVVDIEGGSRFCFPSWQRLVFTSSLANYLIVIILTFEAFKYTQTVIKLA